MKHVFISYRHESVEHARAVRLLGELLRQAGLPVELDQFYLEAHPAGPDEGWPKWCEDRANRSECVLIIGSLGWCAAYDKTAPGGIGLGAATEADLFRQNLYDQGGNNERIRIAFVDASSANAVPERLRAWHQFRPFASNRELDQLIAWIAGRLGLSDVESPTVRWPSPLPDFLPDIANRHVNEWPAVQEMLAGKSPHRILLLEAESGYGKSEMVHQSIIYSGRLGIPVVHLDFRANYSGLTDVLGRIALELGEHLPNFAREGGDKTHLLIKDLRALRRPVLVVLDTFEKASGVFQDWICQNLLAEVERALSVAVIVAGQPSLPAAEDMRWRSVARHLPLGPIRDAAHWQPWIERRYPDFRERKIDLATLILASGGVPKTFSDFCRTIAGQSAPPHC